MVEAFIGEATTAGDILVRSLQRAANLVSSFKQVAVEQGSARRCRFVLRDAMQGLEALCRRPGFTVNCSTVGAIQIDSYPGPLTDVLLQLVDNAMVHGYADLGAGEVFVSAKPASPGWIELTVQDRGVGIAAASLDRIFDPFFYHPARHGQLGLGPVHHAQHRDRHSRRADSGP